MNASASLTFYSLLRAARAALQWRLLLLWAAWMLIPTLVLAVPMWQMLGAQLDHSVHAASLARQLDAVAVADLLAAHGKNAALFTHAGITALVLTLLLSPLLTGMAATAARSSAPPGFGALMAGAVAKYPRMLRMLIWAVLPLGLAGALGNAALNFAGDVSEQAVVAFDATLANAFASVLMIVLMLIAHATLDAGRAALATDRRRNSAVKAWWGGCQLLLRRPLASMAMYLAISAVGLGLAALLGVARVNMPTAGMAGFIGALVLTQLVVLAIAWMRSARLFAMVELARSTGETP